MGFPLKQPGRPHKCIYDLQLSASVDCYSVEEILPSDGVTDGGEGAGREPKNVIHAGKAIRANI